MHLASSCLQMRVWPESRTVATVYGRATDKPDWKERLQEFVSQLHNSTKDSCSVMLGGLLHCGHTKSKSASEYLS